MALSPEERKDFIEKLIKFIEQEYISLKSILERKQQEHDELTNSETIKLKELNLHSEYMKSKIKEKEDKIKELDYEIDKLEKEKKNLAQDLDKLRNYLATFD